MLLGRVTGTVVASRKEPLTEGWKLLVVRQLDADDKETGGYVVAADAVGASVGDSDGVIVIPAALVDEIATEAFEMTAFEDFVTEQVEAGRSILGLYPATDPQTKVDFEAWRKANHR